MVTLRNVYAVLHQPRVIVVKAREIYENWGLIYDGSFKAHDLSPLNTKEPLARLWVDARHGKTYKLTATELTCELSQLVVGERGAEALGCAPKTTLPWARLLEVCDVEVRASGVYRLRDGLFLGLVKGVTT